MILKFRSFPLYYAIQPYIKYQASKKEKYTYSLNLSIMIQLEFCGTKINI